MSTTTKNFTHVKEAPRQRICTEKGCKAHGVFAGVVCAEHRKICPAPGCQEYSYQHAYPYCRYHKARREPPKSTPSAFTLMENDQRRRTKEEAEKRRQAKKNLIEKLRTENIILNNTIKVLERELKRLRYANDDDSEAFSSDTDDDNNE